MRLTFPSQLCFVQILVTLFSATLLSVKTITTRGKLVQCSSLSSLAESLGTKAFVQIDIPLDVYVCVRLIRSRGALQHSSKLVTLPAPTRQSKRRSSCPNRTSTSAGHSAFR